MISEAGAKFKKIVREEIAEGFTAEKDYLAQREALSAMTEGAEFPDDMVVTEVNLNGVHCETVTDPNSREDRIIIHFHGGGCRLGSPKDYRGFVLNIVQATRAKVILPDFRLAPENDFPSGIEDCFAVYEAVLDSGVSPKQIAVSGDSGGGQLLLGTLLMIKEKGLPMPAAAFTMSPMTDSTCSGKSYSEQKENDPWLAPEVMYVVWKQYAPAVDPKLPLLSPVFADLSGLPPLLIQVGEHEILLDDAVMLEKKALEDGVDATLHIFEEMWHVFHFFGTAFPEGEVAYKEIGEFVEKHLG